MSVDSISLDGHLRSAWISLSLRSKEGIVRSISYLTMLRLLRV